MNAEQAIHESIVRNRIVELKDNAEDRRYLARHCDDSVETGQVTEYWGVDDDGNDWRVHIAWRIK